MTSFQTPSDPAKSTYRDQWDVSADAWNTWWHVFERSVQVLSDELVARAGLVPGERVLDLACGLGEPSFTAARRVGEHGRILGVDLSPRMITLAREKARQRGVSHVTFEVGDGEDLQVPDASFDAAVSRFGLMLLPRPELGARHLLRALKPGGRLAAAVWAGPEHNPFFSVPQSVAERLGLAPPLDLDVPGPMRMGRVGLLEQCLVDAGFVDVVTRPFALSMSFASTREFVDYQRGMHGALKKALQDAEPAAQARGWGELERALAPFVGADGGVSFPSLTWVATGRRAP